MTKKETWREHDDGPRNSNVTCLIDLDGLNKCGVCGKKKYVYVDFLAQNTHMESTHTHLFD